MGFSQGTTNSVNLDQMLRDVGELNILSHYLGISKIPCLISSPLRVDKNPSFSLYSYDGIKIWFTDFATGDRGGIIDLLSEYWKKDFLDTIVKISRDLDDIKSKTNNITVSKSENFNNIKKVHDVATDLQCKVREWRKYDIKFWKQYGISLPWLKFGDIYPISHIIITKYNNTYTIPADKYAYAYVERKDGKVSLKIYQPYNKEYKWNNNHDSSVWDLWTKLPEKGNILIITSSRKDALCIWENTGIPSVSLQAESNMPKKHVVQQLKDRFDKIYILYDNDYDSEVNRGRLLGRRLAKEFDLIQIEIPDKYKSKDPSDLHLNHGKEILTKTINKMI